MYVIVANDLYHDGPTRVAYAETAQELVAELLAISEKCSNNYLSGNAPHFVIIEGQDLRVIYPN